MTKKQKAEIIQLELALYLAKAGGYKEMAETAEKELKEKTKAYGGK